MGLPTSMTQDLGSRAVSGIVIGFKPTTGTRYRIELQRSTQSSTASTSWTSIFLDPSSKGFSYRDQLPLSTRTYYYRARQLGVGSSNSSFSLKMSAKPARFPEVWRDLSVNHNNLGNVEVLGGDIWLSSSKTAKVGQQQSTGTKAKTVFTAAAAFLPMLSTGISYRVVSAYLTVNGSTAQERDFVSPLILPLGVTITAIRFRGYRTITAQLARLRLFRGSSTGAQTILATATHTATTWQTITTNVTEVVSSTSKTYALELDLRNNSTLNPNVRALWAEVSYTMPSYDKGI